MNAGRRWYELLPLGVAALAIIGMGAVQTKAYEYVQSDPEYDYEEYGSPLETDWETYYGNGWGTAYADEGGSCSCEANAGTETFGASVSAYENAYGWWLVEWTYNGPPYNAPGGTLSWSISGSGSASAYGSSSITYPGDAATSASSGDSSVWGSGTEGSADGSGEASGFVSDYNLGSCEASASGYPEEDFDAGDPEEDESYGGYSASISWSISSSDAEEIPSGTSCVYFDGGADCSGSSSANSTGTGHSSSDARTSASVSVSASFP